jgi:hypothetical protein
MTKVYHQVDTWGRFLIHKFTNLHEIMMNLVYYVIKTQQTHCGCPEKLNE